MQLTQNQSLRLLSQVSMRNHQQIEQVQACASGLLLAARSTLTVPYYIVRLPVVAFVALHWRCPALLTCTVGIDLQNVCDCTAHVTPFPECQHFLRVHGMVLPG